jgi:RNA polymerase sigma-70 factor (ECF subfamily)
MAARLTRAKKKIAAAGIPYVVPDDLAPRLDTVLAVVHLLATTGHTAPSGEDLARTDLAERALDLARMLLALLPDEREAAGLLALLLLLRARSATRGDVLEDQDRSRWDNALIAEADALIVAALKAGPPGRFTLQAAIAGVHAAAPTYADTDWPQLRTLYDVLLRVWPSPVVALNRAVVLAETDGPAAALAATDAIDGLASYRYLWSTRADLLRRLGRHEEAGAAYREALRLTDNTAERAFLEARLD